MFDANTTINQLTNANNGVQRLSVMIGLKSIARDDNKQFVSFKFKAKGNGKANYCRITLNSDDTYTMRLSKIWGVKELNIKEYKGLYCDMLKETFEQHTALYLSL